MVIIIGIGHVIVASLQRLATVTASVSHGYLTMATVFRRRTCCLHTSHLCIGASPVAGGKDEVTPVSIWQRAFAIAVFLVAFIMASIFVGASPRRCSLCNSAPSGGTSVIQTSRRPSSPACSPKRSMRQVRCRLDKVIMAAGVLGSYTGFGKASRTFRVMRMATPVLRPY